MRALPPLIARAALSAVVLLGSALAAAAVLFVTGPVTGAASAVPHHLSATVDSASVDSGTADSGTVDSSTAGSGTADSTAVGSTRETPCEPAGRPVR
ncbi:hypothetical protein JOL79_13160 [Microbispora sp. RL4-1S]|uniref:Uncharacterized protein n=1 Tax=Microbispora oryzae TaxID=2806554 RepID=A0A940WKV8_9ACTN|nr:hypothetical protein [Microbispora oryzae]MBP2704763.1 hypothetical protein [Microbispora oryzae]